MSEAATAERAEAAVQAVAQLDAARTGVEHEVVPVLSATVLLDPALSAMTGLSPVMVEAQLAQAEQAIAQAQQVTDRALASVPAASAGAGAAERAAARLVDVRAGSQTRILSLTDTYARYLAVSGLRMAAQQEAAWEASAQEVTGGTYRATRDVELVAELTQASSRVVPLFLGAQLRLSGTGGSDLDWRSAWVAYTDAQRQLDDLSRPTLAAAWADVRTSAAVTAVDDVLAAQAEQDTAAPLSIEQVDTLKIDRSFIGSSEPGHGELVSLMIRAAHTFGLTVVAEGVEEPAQLARLRTEACDQAQGYLLHRPLPAAEAGALLRSGACASR